MRESEPAACMRLVDDGFRDVGLHRQDFGRAADDGAGEQFHAVCAARELATRAIARLLSRRHLSARPAILLVQLANIDRCAVLRIERRVDGQQQRAANLAALDPRAQRHAVARHARDVERGGETPARQHALQCRFENRCRLGHRLQEIRHDQMHVAVPEPRDDRPARAVDHGRAGRHGCLACRSDALDAAVPREHRRVRDRRGVGRWIDGGADDGQVASARDRRQPEDHDRKREAELSRHVSVVSQQFVVQIRPVRSHTLLPLRGRWPTLPRRGVASGSELAGLRHYPKRREHSSTNR